MGVPVKKIFVLFPLALLLTVPHAQQKKSRVAFVNVPQLVSALPNSSAYLTLRKNVDADLTKRQASIRTLLTKAQSSPTAANRNALTKAQKDYAAAQKGYQSRLANAFKPLASKLDSAIATAAKANGYSVVLDRQVAARSGLVVYANPATDLTQAVLKNLKK